ncbi:hypothetical protein HGA88_03305 [Candidatus Roizmanbacteria bacterium]|nr:hypothetical protein [Candidatus Roizmanbacteria bacterium]
MKTMKNNAIIIPVVVAVVVGAGAFYGGIKYQQSKVVSTFQGAGIQTAGAAGGFQRGTAGRMATGVRPVIGQIVSSDSESITVKLQDGSSKIVNITDTTKISKTDAATKTDLVTGQTVSAFGSANSDGSVNAQSIQLNPLTNAVRGTGTRQNPNNQTGGKQQ